jgi:hypothetical protein
VNGSADKVVTATNAAMHQSNKRKHQSKKTVAETIAEVEFDKAVAVTVDDVSFVTDSSKESNSIKCPVMNCWLSSPRNPIAIHSKTVDS